ncbi:MAG: bifunctional nicotinamidase/pyrazinamidase [Deltaproteobacteria bacterium]|nr:bifunctional nicotinamidase/pyrazinamidase [Candidatus Zymogenaceae bacterium]
MSSHTGTGDIRIINTDGLIVVDLQPDFMPGGPLAVPGGNEIIDGINRLVPHFSTVVASQDWHPGGHKSFASAHPGKKPNDLFEAPGLGPVLWPDHCVQGTVGAEYHPDFHFDHASLLLRKGTNLDIDSYSVFLENDMETKTGLSGYLDTRGVTRIFLCGLALDYCVAFSAKDGIRFGFDTVVLEDLTRPVDSPPGHKERMIGEMTDMGVSLITSDRLTF